MRICLVGCCHGELHRIYEKAQALEADLVVIAGDFQAVRDSQDLASMAVPLKYQRLGDFHEYYNNTKTAPILTVVIGGNHEASNFMMEYPNGGWLAENIYYLGRVGVVQIGGVNIGGISGVYAPEHYDLCHFEKVPFNSHTLRSVYHIRRCDVDRLKRYEGPIDLMVSHDWPRGIHNFGDIEWLLKRKKFLAKDISTNRLGSPAAMELLQHFKPRIWLSAHMHVNFSAHVPPTEFIALDKAEGRREFWQLVEMPSGGDLTVKVLKNWRKLYI